MDKYTDVAKLWQKIYGKSELLPDKIKFYDISMVFIKSYSFPVFLISYTIMLLNPAVNSFINKLNELNIEDIFPNIIYMYVCIFCFCMIINILLKYFYEQYKNWISGIDYIILTMQKDQTEYEDSSSSQKICAICLEDLKNDFTFGYGFVPCGHAFHIKCYDKLIKSERPSNRHGLCCPECRTSLWDRGMLGIRYPHEKKIKI